MWKHALASVPTHRTFAHIWCSTTNRRSLRGEWSWRIRFDCRSICWSGACENDSRAIYLITTKRLRCYPSHSISLINAYNNKNGGSIMNKWAFVSDFDGTISHKDFYWMVIENIFLKVNSCFNNGVPENERYRLFRHRLYIHSSR